MQIQPFLHDAKLILSTETSFQAINEVCFVVVPYGTQLLQTYLRNKLIIFINTKTHINIESQVNSSN